MSQFEILTLGKMSNMFLTKLIEWQLICKFCDHRCHLLPFRKVLALSAAHFDFTWSGMHLKAAVTMVKMTALCLIQDQPFLSKQNLHIFIMLLQKMPVMCCIRCLTHTYKFLNLFPNTQIPVLLQCEQTNQKMEADNEASLGCMLNAFCLSACTCWRWMICFVCSGVTMLQCHLQQNNPGQLFLKHINIC